MVTPVCRTSYFFVSLLLMALPCSHTYTALHASERSMHACLTLMQRGTGPLKARAMCTHATGEAKYNTGGVLPATGIQGARTLSFRSHLPTRREPPHAIVSSIIVEPASVPTPTLTCNFHITALHKFNAIICRQVNWNIEAAGVDEVVSPTSLPTPQTFASLKVASPQSLSEQSHLSIPHGSSMHSLAP